MGRLLRGINGMARGTANLILRAANGALLKPQWLWFEAIDRCNSRCMQCNIWHKKAAKNLLIPQEIKKAFGDPIFKNVKVIINAGGEPALRDDLEEVVMAEHEAIPKAKIMIGTNALLPERIVGVVKSAIKNKIDILTGISLDGIGEDHDDVRGIKGNFKKAEWLLNELSALGQTHQNGFPCIGFTLIDRTLPHMEAVRSYAEKMKVSFLIQWYNQSPYYNNEEKDLVKDKALMVEAVRRYPPSLLNETGIRWLESKSIKFRCFAMNMFCMVHCNGDISPCLGHWNITAGNIRKNSPTEIWQSDEAKKIRRNVRACKGCLNSCGVMWSADASFYPLLKFWLKQKMERLKGRS